MRRTSSSIDNEYYSRGEYGYNGLETESDHSSSSNPELNEYYNEEDSYEDDEVDYYRARYRTPSVTCKHQLSCQSLAKKESCR